MGGSGVAVVGDDVEEGTQGVKGEFLDRIAADEGAIAFQVQRQGHGVQARILQAKSEGACLAGGEGLDMIADVLAYDGAVAQIRQESIECAGCGWSAAALS